MLATDKVIQKNQNTAKKLKIGYTITKWRKNNNNNNNNDNNNKQTNKQTNKKSISIEIWLIIEVCKYNYTAEIKFEKQLFGCAFMGKTNFEQCPKNANLC